MYQFTKESTVVFFMKYIISRNHSNIITATYDNGQDEEHQCLVDNDLYVSRYEVMSSVYKPFVNWYLKVNQYWRLKLVCHIQEIVTADGRPFTYKCGL